MKQMNIDAAYREFIDGDEGRAPEIVKTRYDELQDALDRYLEGLTEFEWKAGFSYAVKLMEERKVHGNEKN